MKGSNITVSWFASRRQPFFSNFQYIIIIHVRQIFEYFPLVKWVATGEAGAYDNSVILLYQTFLKSLITVWTEYLRVRLFRHVQVPMALCFSF